MSNTWETRKVGNTTVRMRTTNIRTVHHNGRPIEVGTIEIEGLPSPRRGKQKNLFVILTHADAVAGFKAVHCPMALVWYALLFRAWASKSNTVKLPTALLRSWGLNRSIWGRAISHLEQAGLIQTERWPGQTVTCRLLGPNADDL